MSLDEAKIEELIRTNKALARDARAAVREAGRVEDAAVARFSVLEHRVEQLEQNRGLTHRAIDLLKASPVLQKAVAAALVIVALALGLLMEPSLKAALPLLGAAYAP